MYGVIARSRNDTGAKDKVAELIGDAGLQPVDAGALQNAPYIEPLAMLMMELGHRQRMGSDIAIRLMHLARATPPATLEVRNTRGAYAAEYK